MGLTGLTTDDGKKREQARNGGAQTPPLTYRDLRNMSTRMPMVQPFALPSNFGDSRYDERSVYTTDLQNLSNYRGLVQPGIAQIGSGIIKGVALAGTTFANGVIGMPVGIVEGAASLLNGEGLSNAFSKVWNNEVTNLMQDINTAMEDVLPNYYTDYERTAPWYKNIFTANFIGDKFIKNLGFTVGALYSGKAFNAGLDKLLNLTNMALKTKGIVETTMGSFVGAVAEGSIEALNGVKDWKTLEEQKINDAYNRDVANIGYLQGTPEYDAELGRISAVKQNALNKVNEDATKMGNSIALLNTAFLWGSNAAQFGKFLTSDFNTARKAANITFRESTDIAGKGTFEVVKGATAGRYIGAAIKNPLIEGNEEITQKIISTAAGDYYAADVENFYKAGIDPTFTEQTVDAAKSIANSILNTLSEGSTWEEGFIGALTGGLGSVVFGSKNAANSDINIANKVGLSGGIVGEIASVNKQAQRDNYIASYLNKRLQDPQYENFIQGWNRRNLTQQQMDFAAMQGDEKAYKDAAFDQLITDLIMFDNAGQLNMWKDIVKNSLNNGNYTKEEIDEIRELTSKEAAESGNPKNDIYKDKSDEEMQAILKKNVTKKFLEVIDKYQKIKDKIDVRAGGNFSDAQLAELTWLAAKVSNWKERSTKLTDEVIEGLQNLRDNTYAPKATLVQSIKDIAEGKETTEPSRVRNVTFDENIDNLIKILADNRKMAGTILDEEISKKANKSVTVYNAIVNWLNSLKDVEDIATDFSEGDDITDIKTKINDLMKMNADVFEFNNTLYQYLSNPGELERTQSKIRKKVERKKKANDIKQEVNNIKDAQTPEEKKQAYDNASPEAKKKAEQTIPEVKKMVEDDDFFKALSGAIDKIDTSNLGNLPENFKDVVKGLYNEVYSRDNSVRYNPYAAIANYVANEGMMSYSTDFIEPASQILSEALRVVYDGKAFANTFKDYVPYTLVASNPTTVVTKSNYDEINGTPIVAGTDRNKTATEHDANPDESLEVNTPIISSEPHQSAFQNEIVTAIPKYDRSTKYTKEALPFWEGEMITSLSNPEDTESVKQAEQYIQQLKETPTRAKIKTIAELLNDLKAAGIEVSSTDTTNPDNIKLIEKYVYGLDPEGKSFNNGLFRGYYDIWNLLDTLGAFDYLDNLHLRIGDHVYFGTIDGFENSTFMFVRDKSSNKYQVVGVVRNNVENFNSFVDALNKALKVNKDNATLVGKNNEEYSAKICLQADLQTTVGNVYGGNVIYDNENTALSLEAFPNGEAPLLGIIKPDNNQQGRAVVGNNLTGKQIIQYGSGFTSDQDGYVVSLIKTIKPHSTGNGVQYYPIVLKTKQLDDTIWTSDGSVQRKVQETVNKIVEQAGTNMGSKWFTSLYEELRKYLYIYPDLRINLYKSEIKDGDTNPTYHEVEDTEYATHFGISNKVTDSNQGDGKSNISFVEITEENLKQLLINGIPNVFDSQPIAKYYNVRADLVNTADYNKQLIESGILETNVKDFRMQGNFFSVPTPNAEGRFDKPEAPKVNQNVPVSINVEEGKYSTICTLGNTQYVKLSNGSYAYKASDGKFYSIKYSDIINYTDGKFTYNVNIYNVIKLIEDASGYASSLGTNSFPKTLDNIIENNDHNAFYYTKDISNVKEIIIVRKDSKGTLTYEPVVGQSYIQVKNNFENINIRKLNAEAQAKAQAAAAAQRTAQPKPVQAPQDSLGLADSWNGKVDVDETINTVTTDTIIDNYLPAMKGTPVYDVFWYSKKENKVHKVRAVKHPSNEFYIQFYLVQSPFGSINLSDGTSNVIRARIVIPSGASIKVGSLMNDSKLTDSTFLVHPSADFKLTQTVVDKASFPTATTTEQFNYQLNTEVYSKSFITRKASEGLVEFSQNPESGYTVPSVQPAQTKERQPGTVDDTLHSIIEPLLETNTEYFTKENGEINRTSSLYIGKDSKQFARFHSLEKEDLENPNRPFKVTDNIILGNSFDAFCREYLVSGDADKAQTLAKERSNPSTRGEELADNVTDEYKKGYALPKDIIDKIVPFLDSIREKYYVLTSNLVVSDTLKSSSGDEVRVAGEMDLLLQDKSTGDTTIWDFKASKYNPVNNPFYKMQLAFYRKGTQSISQSNNIDTGGFIWLNTNKDNFGDIQMVSTGTLPQIYDMSHNNNWQGKGTPISDALDARVEIAKQKGESITEIPDNSSVTSNEPPAGINPDVADQLLREMGQNNATGTSSLDDFIGSLSRVTTETWEPMNLPKELAWLKRVLPQLSNEDHLEIVKDVFIVGNKGTLAHGQFKDAVMKIATLGKRGTVYHESFHAVFNLLLELPEKASIYEEARKKFGNTLTPEQLEEKLAEDFADYTASEEYIVPTLGGKVKAFFKRLKRWVSNWLRISPHIDRLYRDINAGKFAYRDNSNTLKLYSKIASADVIWGHPGVGKTHLFKAGRMDIIDFDSEFKPRINQQLGLKSSEERKQWRKEHPNEYHKMILDLFDEARKIAKFQNKKLLVSDLVVLQERSDYLDLITNMTDTKFIERSHQRGEFDDANKALWKADINNALSKIEDKSKIIDYNGYISELLTVDSSKYRLVDEALVNIANYLGFSPANDFVFNEGYFYERVMPAIERYAKKKKMQLSIETKMNEDHNVQVTSLKLNGIDHIKLNEQKLAELNDKMNADGTVKTLKQIKNEWNLLHPNAWDNLSSAQVNFAERAGYDQEEWDSLPPEIQNQILFCF